MKKKLFRFFLILLAVLIIVGIWQPWILKMVAGEGMLLSKTKGYRATNENGKEINAEFYLKKVYWHDNEVDEIVVRFKEIPRSEYSIGDDYYLILIPGSSWIGRPNQSVDDYKVIFGKGLFQSESGAHFKIINTPDGAGVYQLIARFSFKSDTIRFNTFPPLDQLGKEIIIYHKSPF